MCALRSCAVAHDPFRVSAGFHPLALVRNELVLDVGVCVFGLTNRLGIYRELGTATFTHAKHRDITLSFDDPKFAFRSSDTNGYSSASVVRRWLTITELLNLV